MPETSEAGAGGASAAQPAVLLGTEQWDQVCAGSGRAYRIFLRRPIGPPPPGGYPVLFITDGNSLFPCAAQAVAQRTVAGELRSALIVGIGYPINSIFEASRLRVFDLTPPTPEDYIAIGGARGPFGGADALLDFILGELAPRLAQRFAIDLNDLSLFGDSLGGLLTLHALFNRPTAFRSYIAASPSLWWNGGAVLAAEGPFLARLRGGAAPRLLITVGGLEQSEDGLPTPLREAAPDWTAHQAILDIRAARMVDNARALHRRLAAQAAQTGLTLAFAEFAGETHLSVVPANISRGLSFALGHTAGSREVGAPEPDVREASK